MIVLKNLTKEYNGKRVVDDVNLVIGDGVSFGLLGPNGAGKTTIIKMIASLLEPTLGSVEIDGRSMDRSSKKIKSQMGLVSQHFSLQREMTPVEVLNLHGMLHRIPRKIRKQRIDELISFADMDNDRDKLVGKLSGGNKRKLMIIRSVMHRPKILFLDEPTVGLDANIRRTIWDLLKKLKDDGMTILLTTHYIDEAKTLCDEIGMIMDGKIISQNTPQKYMEQVLPYVVEVFDGQKTTYEFFSDRHSATLYAEKFDQLVTIRKSNLEDVYIAKTNKRIMGKRQ